MAANTPVDQAGSPNRPPSRIQQLISIRAAFIVALVAVVIFAVARVTAQEGTPGASATPEATPAPNARQIELQLQEFNDSGISGTVTLYDAGNRTIVEIDAENTGENHPAHIHVGRCDDLTPDVGYPLEYVGEDGTSTSVVDVSLDDLLADEYAVDLHLAPDELGTLIACADIEGEPTVPNGGTPAATPGTPASTPNEGTGGNATSTATVTATATNTTTATATASATATATTPVETPAPTTPAAETPAAEPTATEASTPVSDGTGGVINTSGNALSVPLVAQGDRRVSGTAVLTAKGPQTLVSIVLDGPAVAGGHPTHLHDGSCASPGNLTIDLNAVDANGISETLVDIPLSTLTGSPYFINVHQSEADWDTWLACGSLSNGTTTSSTGGIQPPATVAPTQAVMTQGDGTAGISGKGVPIGATTALPQQAGVGTSIVWPDDAIGAVIWASSIGAIILAAAAWFIRRGERRHTDHHTRWTRLGI